MANTRVKSRPPSSVNAYCGERNCKLRFLHWHEDGRVQLPPKGPFVTARPIAPPVADEPEEDPMAPTTRPPEEGTPERIRQELLGHLDSSFKGSPLPIKSEPEDVFGALTGQIIDLNKKISWMGDQFTDAFKVHRGHGAEDYGNLKQHIANDFDAFKKKLQALSDFTAGVRALRQPLGFWAVVGATVLGGSITACLVVFAVCAIRAFIL
jgi:hypothetical protein